MAPIAVNTAPDLPAGSSKERRSGSDVYIKIPNSPLTFVSSSEPYQRTLRITEQDADSVTFPLVLRPDPASKIETDTIIEAAKYLAPPASATGYARSCLQDLLDQHGGAVHFKGLPLETAQHFSDFMHNLAGPSNGATGSNTWIPHVDKGLMVVRRPMAPNVATANEGPATQPIGSHNEYGLSTHYPSVIAFFCISPPETGGETPIANSLAIYDRLSHQCPQYIDQIQRRGLTFVIHHPVAKVQGSVQGNSLYNADSFGPTPDERVELAQLTEQQKRELVENKILELATEGGWSAQQSSQNDRKAPAWLQRGFSWQWLADGSINVYQRVPGIRIHPTLQKPSYFNNVGNRYQYSKEHGCLQPPHYSQEKKDYFPPPSFPAPVSDLADPNQQEDEAIPLEWLESAHRVTQELQSHIKWDKGDILIIDNLAVQHARTPWTGDRKLVASLWDQPSFIAKAVPTLE